MRAVAAKGQVGTALRALVAEDEPAMLSLNAGFLRQKGFEVTEASDGERAWGLAQNAVSISSSWT
jgi:DNA-binding response OmpR family regulator